MLDDTGELAVLFDEAVVAGGLGLKVLEEVGLLLF